MKENLQIGKFITFFVLALFLNYFLGIFFADVIVYLQGLYNEHIWTKWTKMWVEISMYYLYVIYILVYAILAWYVLNFFVRINKWFIHVHLAWLLISILTFIFFIINPALWTIVVSKFILALPFISAIGVLLYWIVNGRMELFQRTEWEQETTSSFFWWNRFSQQEDNWSHQKNEYQSQYQESKPWFFSSLFEDIKKSFSQGKENDYKREEEVNNNDIFNNPQFNNFQQPQQFQNYQQFENQDNLDNDLVKQIENLDFDSINLTDPNIKDKLFRQDEGASVLEMIEWLTEKDIAKMNKDSIKQLNSGWIDEKDFDIKSFDLQEIKEEVSAIRLDWPGRAINLSNFMKKDDDNSSDDKEYSNEANTTPVLTREDFWNKEAIIAAWGLASIIKMANQAPVSKKEEAEEVKEESILDNLTNSFFIWFSDDETWVQQLERLYKEL